MKPAFTLRSPETGTDYWIYVEAPSGQTESGPWPTLVFMDGDDQLKAGIAAYRHARAAQTVPPLLLVGVGYGASYTKPANKRIRDYTPGRHSDEPDSGGADAFLAFLTHTLWSALRERYPLYETWRGLAGHSLGSLLVLHAVLRQPPFFTHFLASAPSIWWADRAVLASVTERWRRDFHLPGRAFISVGEEDSQSMTEDLQRLEAQLGVERFTGFEYTVRRFPRKNHFNVLEQAFGEGMVWLNGKSGVP